MTLEESVQHVVMTAIQEVSEPVSYPHPLKFSVVSINPSSQVFQVLQDKVIYL